TGDATIARSISTDGQNNIYVAGNLTESVNFGNVNVYNPGYIINYVAKYSPSGSLRWVKHTSGNSSGSAYGLSIKTDTQGNSYLGGAFFGPVNFGNITLSSYGDEDIYLAKMDSSGNWLWARHGGGSYQEGFYALDTDGNGNLYITGFYGSSSVTFGNYTFNNPSSEDYFLVKYDTAGTVLWAKHGTKSGYYANSFCVDNIGNSYMVTYNSFILKHDNAGNAGWSLNTAASNVRMASDKKGGIYVTGWLSAPSAFGSTTITPIKPNQMYLAMLYDLPPVTTSLKEQIESSTIEVYPNPCNLQIMISMNEPMTGTIKITNAIGETVYTCFLKESSENWSKEINTSHLAKGLYVIEVVNTYNKDFVRAKKLIIQ
ncbi:MAG: T9SS type A sorting domain-containing protein, partial [Bacteroidia bacterium]